MKTEITNTEEFTVSEELEQLRRQYAELKSSLEKQEITNEKLILQSIRKDLRLVESKRWISMLAGLFAISTIVPFSLELGLRTPFIVLSAVWILSMIIGTAVRMKKLAINQLSGESIKEFITEIKKRKQTQFRWLRVNFILFFFWLSYFIGECIHTGMEKEILISLICGAICGAVIGLTLGLRMHNRIIGAYEGILIDLGHPEENGPCNRK